MLRMHNVEVAYWHGAKHASSLCMVRLTLHTMQDCAFSVIKYNA